MDSRITQEELIEIFGSHMPMEAARMLFEPELMTTPDELRVKLRQIATDLNWKLRCLLAGLTDAETPEHAQAILDEILRDYRRAQA